MPKIEGMNKEVILFVPKNQRGFIWYKNVENKKFLQENLIEILSKTKIPKEIKVGNKTYKIAKDIKCQFNYKTGRQLLNMEGFCIY